MCLGIPARVTGDVDHVDLVRVDVAGVERTANRAMLEGDLREGDWVVLHLGFVMERIDEKDALEALSLLMALGEGDEPEEQGSSAAGPLASP